MPSFATGKYHESSPVPSFDIYTDCCPPKKLKYVKPRLGESTLTKIVLDTPNLAKINFSVLGTFGGSYLKFCCLDRSMTDKI